MKFCAGDFSRFDVKRIEIDKKMENIMVMFQDGTVIATPNADLPGPLWEDMGS